MNVKNKGYQPMEYRRTEPIEVKRPAWSFVIPDLDFHVTSTELERFRCHVRVRHAFQVL